MRYKVIIKGNEYKIPEIISNLNKEEIFDKYTIEKDNEKYLDIERLMKEHKKEEIKKICFQAGHFLSMITGDAECAEDYRETFHKINFLSDFADYCFKEGKEEKGLEKKLEELEISLQGYNKFMENPKEEIVSDMHR